MHKQTPVQELSYETYELRQRHEVTLDQLVARSHELKPGTRFSKTESGQWKPTPYPGFAMQAMMLEKGPNANTYQKLTEIRDQLVCGYESILAPLPSESFHQTIANTFSSQRLDDNITSKGLLLAFPNLVAGAVKDLFPPEDEDAICMQLIGLSMFRTAIGVLGVFENKRHFERILDFRNGFYGHRKLVELGVERTRPFIGHVTLAYVESEVSEQQGEALANHVFSLNKSKFQTPLPFLIRKVQFCDYDNLAGYHYRCDYPSALI